MSPENIAVAIIKKEKNDINLIKPWLLFNILLLKSLCLPMFKWSLMRTKKIKNKGIKKRRETLPNFAKYSNISLPEANPAPIIEPIIKKTIFKTSIN